MLRTIRHRKTVLLAALLALVAFQASGWLVAWHAAQSDAQRVARALLHRSDTKISRVMLAVTTLASARLDHREIRLNGCLYDIRSAESRGDSVLLLLYRDVREEALYATLGNLLAPALCNSPAIPAPTAPLYLLMLNWMHAVFLPPDVPDWQLCRRLEQHDHFPCLIPGSQVRLPRPGLPPEQRGSIITLQF